MSGFAVLHGDPSHKVRSFADEILGRREETIRKMRKALTGLVTDLCEQFETLKNDKPQLRLECVRIAETKWTKDGHLLVQLGYDPQGIYDLGPRYHVDDLIAEVVDHSDKAKPLANELGQFLAALVDQFSVLTKHHSVDLGAVAFEHTRWVDVGTETEEHLVLVFDIRHYGFPLCYREARWD
jgi:hypothetical protein